MGGMRETYAALGAQMTVPSNGRTMSLSVSDEHRIAPAFLHRLLTVNDTVTQGVERDPYLNAQGQFRNLQEALRLARIADLLFNEFLWSEMINAKAIETLVTRIKALMLASEFKTWELASEVEEFTASDSLREQDVLKMQMRRVKLNKSITPAQKTASKKKAKPKKAKKKPASD